jgi:hypothetical protein
MRGWKDVSSVTPYCKSICTSPRVPPSYVNIAVLNLYAGVAVFVVQLTVTKQQRGTISVLVQQNRADRHIN